MVPIAIICRYALLVVALVLAGCVSVEPEARGVIREMPAEVTAGAEFTVTLTIMLDPTDSFYIIEEEVPSGFSTGTADPKNRIKIVDLEASGSTVYSYTLIAPDTPKRATFSGRYALDGMDEPAVIRGDTTIVIR